MSSAQLAFIVVTCARCGLDPLRYANAGRGRYDRVDDVPDDVAAVMCEHLSGLLTDPKKLAKFLSERPQLKKEGV